MALIASQQFRKSLLNLILFFTRNSLAAAWSPPKSKRFKEERHAAQPDCGTYTVSDTFSHDDSYILSKYRTPGTKRIVPLTKEQLLKGKYFNSRTRKDL
jgi:hypothetical protein